MIFVLAWEQIEWLWSTKNMMKNGTVHIYLLAFVIPNVEHCDWLISNFAEGKLRLLLMTLSE